MSTPNEAWRRRRTARLYDTEPRMHAGLVGESPELGSAPDHACRGCGFHVCGCELKHELRSLDQPPAPAYTRVDLANGRVRWDCSGCGDVLCRGREADAQRMADGHACKVEGANQKTSHPPNGYMIASLHTAEPGRPDDHVWHSMKVPDDLREILFKLACTTTLVTHWSILWPGGEWQKHSLGPGGILMPPGGGVTVTR